MTVAADPACLAFPLTAYPGFNKFVADWLGGTDRFLPRSPATSNPQPATRDPQLITALIESNQRWGAFVKDDVQRWANGESIALVAGQQVGFAGGPLYTIVKLASLLRMKRELEKQGKPATVFFWLATEDHDYSEVATIKLPSRGVRQTDLITLRASRGVDSKAAVGTLPVPEELIAELLSLMNIARPSWLRPGITFRDSFAELLATIVPSGVVFVDAMLPELRRAGAPLFESIGKNWDAMQRALHERSRELTDAGYAPQVVAREGEYTLFFKFDEDGNREIFSSGNDLTPPERISTSALTRPLLQDFVLQPDVFLGGPAEVAYYAQIAPLHELLGVAMPRVALRAHALVAPKRVVRLFSRFGIEPQEIFASPDDVLASREPRGVAEVKSVAAEAHDQLDAKIARIRELALPADHALARSINRSVGHIDYHFRKLTERAIRGLVRKDRDRYAALKELVATLYPDRTVQDRCVSWFAWWAEFDNHLLDALVDCVEPDSNVCKIVSL
jgi:uncharacterized protein YllA (UPF0747 family)